MPMALPPTSANSIHHVDVNFIPVCNINSNNLSRHGVMGPYSSFPPKVCCYC